MGSTRLWLVLIAVQIGTLALLAAAGPTTAATPALRYVGYACLAGIFASVPPLVVKLFVAAQVRVGNGAHPMVRGLRQREVAVVVTVWAVIVAALAMAMPRIRSDLRADAEATSAVVALAAAAPVASPPPAPDDRPVADTVWAPGPGSPQRAAILDALRQRLKTSGRYRVDHLRVAGGWAFVRATEVVALDDGEQQETDLTVAALLERPAGSTTGWWRIAELWTLPGEQERPLAAFVRSVRQRLRAERLPDALLPDDL